MHEATYPYAIKNQRKARKPLVGGFRPKAPSRVPWAGSLWHKRAGVASLSTPRKLSRYRVDHTAIARYSELQPQCCWITQATLEQNITRNQAVRHLDSTLYFNQHIRADHRHHSPNCLLVLCKHHLWNILSLIVDLLWWLMVTSVRTELYEGWLTLINETKCDDGMTCIVCHAVFCGQHIRQW